VCIDPNKWYQSVRLFFDHAKNDVIEFVCFEVRCYEVRWNFKFWIVAIEGKGFVGATGIGEGVEEETRGHVE